MRLLDVHTDPDHHRIGAHARRRGRRPRPWPRRRSTASTSPATPASTPASAWSTSCRSSPSTASTAGRRAGGPRPLLHAGPATSSACPASATAPERTLPEVRRGAFAELAPDCGPPQPHPTAGAIAVGARPLLVAYNVWLAEPDLALARRIAAGCAARRCGRSGWRWATQVQVSMNLIDPLVDRAGRRGRRDRRAGARSTGASWWAWCPRRCCEREPAEPLGRARPGRRPDDRGPALAGRSGGSGGAAAASPASASRAVRRARARWRRMRRRSRSLRPPQMPNFSPLASAYSRQSSRTTQPLQTSLASRVDAPRSGKKRSGSTPRQLAKSCQPLASVVRAVVHVG